MTSFVNSSPSCAQGFLIQKRMRTNCVSLFRLVCPAAGLFTFFSRETSRALTCKRLGDLVASRRRGRVTSKRSGMQLGVRRGGSLGTLLLHELPHRGNMARRTAV